MRASQSLRVPQSIRTPSMLGRKELCTRHIAPRHRSRAKPGRKGNGRWQETRVVPTGWVRSEGWWGASGHITNGAVASMTHGVASMLHGVFTWCRITAALWAWAASPHEWRRRLKVDRRVWKYVTAVEDLKRRLGVERVPLEGQREEEASEEAGGCKALPRACSAVKCEE